MESDRNPRVDINADLIRIRAYVDESRRKNLRRLPAEGRLAEELGVSRSRLRGLLKRLELEGVIWRHVGKGTFVGERSLTPEIGSLPDVLSPLEAFEARLVIEPQLAALAALRASTKQIQEMQDCQKKMEALNSFEEWLVWDERLHRIVAKAAQNTLLLTLYDTIRESAPSGMRNRVYQVFAERPRLESNLEHHAYIQAIADRNATLAEDLMRAHLLSVRQGLFGGR